MQTEETGASGSIYHETRYAAVKRLFRHRHNERRICLLNGIDHLAPQVQ